MNWHDREKLGYPFDSGINGECVGKFTVSFKLNKLKNNSDKVSNKTGKTNQQNDYTFLDIFNLSSLNWMNDSRNKQTDIADNVICQNYNTLLKKKKNSYNQSMYNDMIVLDVNLDVYQFPSHLLLVKISNIQFSDLTNNSPINDIISNDYHDFRFYINSSLVISVIIQILITRLTIHYRNDNSMKDQENLSSGYASDNKDYIIIVLLNSVISTNLMGILNKVVQIMLDIFENIFNMCIHRSQIMVNHVLVANDIDVTTAILRVLSIHSFDYNNTMFCKKCVYNFF